MFPKPKKLKNKNYGRWLAFNYGHKNPPHHVLNPEGGGRRNRDDCQVPIPYDIHYGIEHTGVGKRWEKENNELLQRLAGACWDAYQRGDTDCATVHWYLHQVIASWNSIVRGVA